MIRSKRNQRELRIERAGGFYEKSQHTVVVAWPLRALAAEAIAKTETTDDRILVDSDEEAGF